MSPQRDALKESELVAQVLDLQLSAEEKEMLAAALEEMKVHRLSKAVTFDFFGGPKVDLDSLYVSAKQGKESLEYFAAHP